MNNIIKGILIVLGLVLGVSGLSFLFTAGIIKLITICFGWQFSWAMAMGIWLILLLVSGFICGRK